MKHVQSSAHRVLSCCCPDLHNFVSSPPSLTRRLIDPPQRRRHVGVCRLTPLLPWQTLQTERLRQCLSPSISCGCLSTKWSLSSSAETVSSRAVCMWVSRCSCFSV